MRLLLLPLLFLISASVFAQDTLVKKSYYDKKLTQLYSVQQFVGDTAEGYYRQYRADGSLELETHFHRGEENGMRKNFNPAGTLILATPYAGGLQEGEQREYNDSARLTGIRYYHHNLPDSVWLAWYEDGRLKSEANFRMGIPTGVNRVFFHDGHEKFYCRYVNGIREGRYLQVNDQHLTVEEGYLWHDRWVWHRKFCNNKFCEMGGMDTISGKDSVMYYDEHANLIGKTVSWNKDSLPVVFQWNWRPTGFLYYYSEQQRAPSGFYVFSISTWSVEGKDTFLLRQRTDSCYLEKRIRPEELHAACKTSLLREFYPNGQLKEGQKINGDTSWLTRYYESGMLATEGLQVKGANTGLWINYLDSGRVEHTWFGLAGIADTIYFPGGKPGYVNRIEAGNLYETGYELYPSGGYRRKWLRDDREGTYEVRESFFPDGRKESYSFHRRHGIHYFEETMLFYPDGRMKQRDRTTAGLWRARQSSRSWYADGNLSSRKTIRRRISLFHRKHPREKVRFKSWYSNGRLRIKTHFTETTSPFWTKNILRGHVVRWDETGEKTEHRRLKRSDKPEELFGDSGNQRVKF